MQHAGSQSPSQGLNLCAMQWKYSLNHWTTRNCCFFYEVENEICKNVKNDTKFFVWGNTFYKKNLLLIRKELTILK